MGYRRRIRDELLDLGGLLLAYVFVGLPVGSGLAVPSQSAFGPAGQTVLEAGLLSGAVVIALAEVTENRPGPAESIAFFGAYGFVQVPALAMATLLWDTVQVRVVVNVCVVLSAYVFAIQWGPAGTASRFTALVRMVVEVPDRGRAPSEES